jgi:hypothetical protein
MNLSVCQFRPGFGTVVEGAADRVPSENTSEIVRRRTMYH